MVKQEYDSLNRLTKSIDAEAGESLYTYDGKGNLMSLRDGRSNLTTYSYDVLDRLIRRTNPLNQSESFAYNNEGYMTEHLNRRGELARYTYDSANQLIGKSLEGEGGEENSYIYSYDMDGNLISLSDEDSRISYEYDELDRIISSSTEGSAKQPSILQLYKYDGNSNRTSLKAGFSDEDEEDYWEQTYTYDQENQLTSLNSPAGNFEFEYDDLSRITRMIYPNGMKTEMSYEGDFRLKKIEHIKEARLFDEVKSLFKYDYDPFNNRKSAESYRRRLPINEKQSYTYNKKDELLTATHPLQNETNESFTYDITGNRLRKAGQTQDSVYNANNQLTDDQTYLYTYDSKGNLIQKTHKVSKATTKYHWDIENQLTQVTKHEEESALPSETINYAYDALNRRIEKNINGQQNLD